ncbi:hypothetical protein ES703_99065 [subsurface metagenome]
MGFYNLGQLVVSVDHHERAAIFLETLNNVTQGPQRQSPLKMLGEVESYANRAFLCTGKVAKPDGGGFSISYERTLGQQAVPDTAGNRPYPYITLLTKCRLSYDFQCVLFFIGNDGYAAVVAGDELFELLYIVH